MAILPEGFSRLPLQEQVSIMQTLTKKQLARAFLGAPSDGRIRGEGRADQELVRRYWEVLGMVKGQEE